MVEKFIFVGVALASLFLGAFIYLKPQKTFAMQKKFYAMINWNIEPISMEKEMRNTKVMGLFLMIFVMFTCFYVMIEA
ncbi:MAG: hypothetical protein WC552_02350 [Candidatus Omnitrophota bacterium]